MNFSTHPLAHVESIRKILREYKSDSFFKELLQNANDAGASRVWLYVHQGLDNCSHPLLSNPGLIVINDGPFEEKHMKGISSIGLSNRASDQSTIGRFGLGIKSVFHLCEGFFFLESGKNKKLRNFLTPWHGATKGEEGGAYNDWWDIQKKDWDCLDAKVNEIFQGEEGQQWFALAIPFRKQDQIEPNSKKYLRNEFPGDDDGYAKKLSQDFQKKAPAMEECLVFIPRIQQVTFQIESKKPIHVHRPGEEETYVKELEI